MQHGVDGRVDVAEPEEEGVEPTRDAARRAPAVDQVDGEEAAEPIEMSSSCGVDGLRWPIFGGTGGVDYSGHKELCVIWAARISPGEGSDFLHLSAHREPYKNG